MDQLGKNFDTIVQLPIMSAITNAHIVMPVGHSSMHTQANENIITTMTVSVAVTAKDYQE